MSSTTTAPPVRPKAKQALPTMLGIATLMGAAALSAPSAHALTGTGTLSPGTTYNAPVGTNFSLDFSGIFGDAAMAEGNYWQFDLFQQTGSASYSSLGWEVSSDNGTTWSQVDWSSLDPIGNTTATTVPALNVSNEFPLGTNTISLGLGAPGTSLVSNLLPKANFSTLNGVRLLGTVSGATTPYLTSVSISDVLWSGPGSGNDPSFRNSYEANLTSDVPGPLPVLGAIGALGMARRLRKRVQGSAPA
jgi:hypothetical protein